MLDTIETRLTVARQLLNSAEAEYRHGSKERAARHLEAASIYLPELLAEMQAEMAPAEDALVHCCGHCGKLCHVNELQSGACPRCGTLKEGVLVVAKVDKWQEREEAQLRKPQGHAVRVKSGNGETWIV